jgi:hypothetical protein
MSVISSIAIQVTREHAKSYKGIPRVRAINTRWRYPNSSRASSDPPKTATFAIIPPAFPRFFRPTIPPRAETLEQTGCVQAGAAMTLTVRSGAGLSACRL